MDEELSAGLAQQDFRSSNFPVVQLSEAIW
jgi:hypothetical protein